MRACLLAFLIVAAPAMAEAEPASWYAMSKTAMAITGDIVLDDYKLTFASGKGLDIEPYEMAREGDWASDGSSIAGDVFKIDPPESPKLLHGNAFCDTPASYVVVWMPEQGELTLSVYSGDAAPIGNEKVDRLCASYSYASQ